MLSAKAGAAPTAPKNNQQMEAYQTCEPVSILKFQIGTLLLALQGPLSREQRKTGYRLLEVLLLARYERGAL